MKQLPRHLIPKYFDAAISLAVRRSIHRIKQLCHLPASCDDDELLEGLLLGSVQMLGPVKSTGLHPEGGQVTMSAGLPHFSTHHMRCWGRDTFIAMRGLLLLPGRWERAAEHLKAFAGCLYRGLIPNLLDSGRRPRYNARDACWWFLMALRQYCEERDDLSILNEAIPLRHPGAQEYVDFDDARMYQDRMPMKQIVQEILQAHALGISFREWNAGPALDGVMQEAGFLVEASIDWSTGMVVGGNRFNCGTWMDKMGESSLAGNRGWPATPRNGAAVELQALLATTLAWCIEKEATFNFNSIRTPKGSMTLSSWLQRLQASFELSFWLPADGYYRDCLGSGDAEDVSLRPNYLVAMSIAKDLLFDQPEHARQALATAEQWLVAPLGMRTLSPGDPRYRPDYHLQPESPDYATSGGFNYHNGPEWLWPLGAYLSACLHFIPPPNDGDPALLRQMIYNRLQPHCLELQRSSWRGLPELTNRDGAYCADSCRTQAWSMACLLEVLWDLSR